MSRNKSMDALNREKGLVRTDTYCTECRKTFYSTIDYNLNGNHEIICPYCGHIHYRVITDGVITEERHNSSIGTSHKTTTERIWNHDNLRMQTSSTSEFLRNRWLNRES